MYYPWGIELRSLDDDVNINLPSTTDESYGSKIVVVSVPSLSDFAMLVRSYGIEVLESTYRAVFTQRNPELHYVNLDSKPSIR